MHDGNSLERYVGIEQSNTAYTQAYSGCLCARNDGVSDTITRTRKDLCKCRYEQRLPTTRYLSPATAMQSTAKNGDLKSTPAVCGNRTIHSRDTIAISNPICQLCLLALTSAFLTHNTKQRRVYHSMVAEIRNMVSRAYYAYHRQSLLH